MVDLHPNRLCCIGDDGKSIGRVGSCKNIPSRSSSPSHGREKKKNRPGTLLLADGNEELNERVIVFRGVGEVSESI